MDPPYLTLQALYASPSTEPFQPLLSPALMAPLSTVCLPIAFASAFYFTTLKHQPAHQALAGTLASLTAGLGVVTLFNAVGVYV